MKLPDHILREYFICEPKDKVLTEGMTVIIPIHGKSRVKQLINSVAWATNQTLDPVEVIIVENGLMPLVDMDVFKQYSNVRYHFIENRGAFCKSACYNAGVSMASYQYICGLDADIIIPSEFLLYGYLELLKKDACFLADDIHFLEGEMEHMLDFNFSGKTWQNDRAKWQFHGGTFFINRQKYYDVGGHDEYFRGYGSEDSEFYKRVHDTLSVSVSTHNILHQEHGREPDSFVNEEKNKAYLYYVQSILLSRRIENLKQCNPHLTGKLLTKSTTTITATIPTDDVRIARMNRLQAERVPREQIKEEVAVNQNEKRRRRILGYG